MAASGCNSGEIIENPHRKMAGQDRHGPLNLSTAPFDQWPGNRAKLIGEVA
jgi:hypothetical protein